MDRAKFAKAVESKRDLDRRAAERRKTAMRDFLFQAIQNGPLALKQATTLVRLAAERVKPDMERDTEYMDRELPRLRDRMERERQQQRHEPFELGHFRTPVSGFLPCFCSPSWSSLRLSSDNGDPSFSARVA